LNKCFIVLHCLVLEEDNSSLDNQISSVEQID
jgi:hypothetical protein